MDKIRKIIAWIWLNKERMVLVVLVVYLCTRVYIVVFPPKPEEEDPVSPPTSKDVADFDPLIAPPNAPPRPATELSGDYSGLYELNPFWYHSKSGQETTDSGEITAESLGVELLQIRVVRGRERAQLKTGRRLKLWYDEGEQFQNFTLVEINPDTNSVIVFSEQYGRDFTLANE